MNKKKQFTKVFSVSIILIAITSGTLYFSLMPFLSNFSSNEVIKDDCKDFLSPISSIAGEHPWWDSNWPYRMLVNITNQAGVDLKNYGVSVVFPYGDPGYQDKVNDTLKDIRVIEYVDNEPIEREFYIFQDFNGEDYSVGDATIYFNTNLSASSNPETDVYLYFGNMNVESTSVEYGLGLVKNGDFEYVPSGDDPTGNPSIAPHYYNPVGWNWSDDVPDDIAPRLPDVGEDSQTEDQATEWWQNCLIDVPGGVEQVRGTYTYKWGSNQTSITDTIGNDDQYAGVLYTNPFDVPIVNDGSGKIYMSLWQNVKVWGFDGSSSKAWNDGYFVRVINATDGIPVDPDQHEQIGEYLEYFKGITHNNKGFYSLQNYTTGTITGTFDTSQGDLTGLVTFDLSDYMGQTISLEFGMYGDENTVGNYDTAFVQVDDIEFTYSDDITVEVNEIQSQKSDITVIARDIDGMITPNAEISLMQGITPIKKQTTDETGLTIFTGLNFGIYNFSVNYRFSPSYEDEVFNSTRDNFGTSNWNLYNVSELSQTFNLYLDIWTIDFEIADWDDDPLSDGYVKVYNDTEGTLLKQISLDNGTARFRWNNASFYYYEVYFYNTRYNVNNFLLNSSYIYRSTYNQNEKYYDHSLPLNTYDQDPSDYYRVIERIYTEGSMSDFSNKKLINFNITLEAMNERIDNMTVYYIDKNNQTTGNIIYQNLTMSGTTYFKSIDIGTIDNDKLKSENYEAYGILIDVQGYNAGAHTGIIKINTTEMTNIYNKTALSKLNIRVIDDADSYNPVPFVSVRVWNGTTIITTLTTNDDGWASHSDIFYKPFIYLIGFSYNITLRRIGVAADFKLNDTSPKQWEPSGVVSIYNYTLTQNSSVILDYEAAPPPPTLETQIDMIAEVSQAIWGSGNLHITINVSYYNGSIWKLVPDEGIFTCYVEDWDTGQTVLIVDLVANYQGLNLMNYSLTINSNKLSAGNSYKNYWFIIDGSVPGYEPPEPYYQQVRVNATSAALNLYDYETRLQVSTYGKEFNEFINLTVRFYSPPNVPLDEATITFAWLSQSLVYFSEDPVYIGYYYCTINTSLAVNVGKYPITITASKENYTSQTIVTTLEVLERVTTINGTSAMAYSNIKVWVEDEVNFTYSYADTILGGQIIGDLDIAVFTWQKLYSNGSIIPGIDGSGVLYQQIDDRYLLDFDTELRSVGFYYLYITLQKNNYEARAALINLEIKYREIYYSLEATNRRGTHISAVQGNDIEITINLIDTTRGNIPLENATVILQAQGTEYIFDESLPGTYTLTFKTDEFEAFFIPQTFPGIIFTQKANFTTEEIDLTITIKMKEIFPGMPTFYFILIIAGSLGIIGSLVAYRVIQQARIPKHVKKIRKVKSIIKSKKSFTESMLIPSKDEAIVKLFGEEWKQLGISLDDVLGVKMMRSKLNKKEGGIK
ncbi:MAG: hypothetical protein ACFFBW_08195 [Promethearchaeota archaeon]